MTAGLAVAKAHSILNVYRSTAFAAASPFVKLHVGDPGSAGTANQSAVTTRNAATFAAPSAGSMAISSIGTWSMTTSETISHISIWDNVSAGNFMESWALTGSVPVVNGSTFSLTTLTLAFTPIAA